MVSGAEMVVKAFIQENVEVFLFILVDRQLIHLMPFINGLN